MRNLKISKKLVVSYGAVLLLFVLCIIVSLFNLVSIRTEVETFYNGPFTVKGAANTLNTNFEAMQKSVFRAVANEDQAITNEAINNAKITASGIQEQLPLIKDRFLGDQAIVTRLQERLNELAPMREHVLNLAAENKNIEAAAYMEQNNIPTIKKVQEELNALIAVSNEKAETMIAGLRAAQGRSVAMLAILGVFSVLVSVAFGTYIAKSISGPTSELVRVAEQLSKGNLDAVIQYQSKDELGRLADSMRATVSRLSIIISDLTYVIKEIASGNLDVHTKNEEAYVGEFRPLLMTLRQMVIELSGTMKQINQSAEQVAGGSDQVSSGAQALSQGATEQASSIEELAATINEMSEQINRNAESASQASDNVDMVGSQVLESNKRMEEMTRAMHEISESSSEISKIIKTIEDIAFQTNILALNAAVEAARAGAAGKGFAVVADEVRSLASKSSEASKNTSALIERSLSAVENGTRIADETAASLQTVVEGTKEITSQISHIASASEEQAQGAAQVTQGIDQISSVVQTNSATAEESAAASEELSGQAQILKQLVSKFILRTEGAGVLSIQEI